MASATQPITQKNTPLWRNEKVLAIVAQALFAIVVIAIFWFLISNMQARLLATKGAAGLRFNFLNTNAGFQIGEGLAMTAQDSFRYAFFVGIVNTIRVAIIGIFLATLLGLFAGIARLSDNWLLSRLAGLYVEIIRSTPLLVQLFFWYFGVILALPDINNPSTISDIVILTNRGIALATANLSATGAPWQWWFWGALLLGVIVGWLRNLQRHRAGRIGDGWLFGTAAFILVAALGYFITNATAALPSNIAYQLNRGDRGTLFTDVNGNGTFEAEIDRPLQFVPITLHDANGETLGTTYTNSQGAYRFYNLPDSATENAENSGNTEDGIRTLQWQEPTLIVIDRPVRQGFNFIGGTRLTPEFAGLVLGLVVYTGAFIAEIVRAGINAVPKGQWEASRALGLSDGTILRMVILPQALRVIIPPLTNQYLNLTKNSSLAIAIGYPDLFNVSMTILNQTGAEVQMFLLIMVAYLSMSLATSLFMNWYNKRIAFAER